MLSVWGRGEGGQYVCTEWQPGETTASAGWLESLLSHQTMRILVYVAIEDFFFLSLFIFSSPSECCRITKIPACDLCG